MVQLVILSKSDTIIKTMDNISIAKQEAVDYLSFNRLPNLLIEEHDKSINGVWFAKNNSDNLIIFARYLSCSYIEMQNKLSKTNPPHVFKRASELDDSEMPVGFNVVGDFVFYPNDSYLNPGDFDLTSQTRLVIARLECALAERHHYSEDDYDFSFLENALKEIKTTGFNSYQYVLDEIQDLENKKYYTKEYSSSYSSDDESWNV